MGDRVGLTPSPASNDETDVLHVQQLSEIGNWRVDRPYSRIAVGITGLNDNRTPQTVPSRLSPPPISDPRRADQLPHAPIRHPYTAFRNGLAGGFLGFLVVSERSVACASMPLELAAPLGSRLWPLVPG